MAAYNPALWVDDPGLFAREALGMVPTPHQDHLFEAVKRGDKRIAVRSGKGPGKTSALAALVLWMLSTRGSCKIPCTSPGWDQLSKVLWPEIDKWRKRAASWIRDGIEVTADVVRDRANPNGCFAVARTSTKEKPEALQGFHEDHLMFVVDEASGVPDEIFQPIEGSLTGPDNRIIMVGNPTRRYGHFYRCFHERGAGWTLLHFNSEESPIVTKDYCERIAKEYGRDSNMYRVQVLGEFPLQDDDALVLWDWVQAAIKRTSPGEGPIKIGVDPARSVDGDASGFVARRGDRVIDLDEKWVPDEMQVTGLARNFRDRVMAANPGAAFGGFFVDVCGLGAGVHDRLKELGEKSAGINVGETSTRRYREIGMPWPIKLRDELWFRARAWVRDRGALPAHEGFVNELTAPKYQIQSEGIKVEGKDSMKKRGLRSPNLADALCLTFAESKSGGMAWL